MRAGRTAARGAGRTAARGAGRTAAVTAAVGSALVAAVVSCALAAGCATTTKSVVRADAQLAIACNVPDARVYVDDVFRGHAIELAHGALLVPSGARRVEVRADGWFTAYRDVSVPHAGHAYVDIDLRRVPDTEPAE
jgi:hypothetical protein